MKDITYCTSIACPSKECRIKIANNSFQPGEIISMADFSGTCRFYIGWMVDKIQREDELMELCKSAGDTKNYFNTSKVQIGMVSFLRALNDAPTIIPAEEEV